MKYKKVLLPIFALSVLCAVASCDKGNGAETSTNASTPTATPTSGATGGQVDTQPTITIPVTDVNFTVTVKDPEGNALPSTKLKLVNSKGVESEKTFTTNSQGVASGTFLSDSTYIVKFIDLDSSYSYNPYEIELDRNLPNGTISLLSVNKKSGSNTIKSPYNVSNTGYYKQSSTKTYNKATFKTAGVYTLSSYLFEGATKLTIYEDSEYSSVKETITTGGDGSNFSYQLDVSASDVSSSKTFYFTIETESTNAFVFSLIANSVGKKIGNKVGNICPSKLLSTIDADGNSSTFELSKETGKGKVIIINFWATWCGYCVAEMPDFADILKDYENVELVAIHQGSSYVKKDTLDFINAETYDRANYGFIWAIGDSSDSYFKQLGGGNGIPYTLILDEDGVILQIFEGQTSYEKVKSVLDTHYAAN